MKKIVAVNLIVFMIISFSCINAFAATDVTEFGGDESVTDIDKGVTPDDAQSMFDKGTTSTNGQDAQSNVPIQTKDRKNTGKIASFVLRIFAIIPEIGGKIVSQIVTGGKEDFTIENLLSNKYEMFDLRNIIDGDSNSSTGDMFSAISNNVAEWFVGIRNLAIIGNAIVLMYVGIRMALATLPQDKAKYKQMLMAWFESIIFLFLLQYIIIFVINASDYIVNFLAKSIDAENANYVENHILNNIYDNIENAGSTLNACVYLVLLITVVYYQIKFFVMYLFRLIRFSFYIIISPLVCVTYAIDKIGDGKAQAFNNLMIEIMVTCFIQPIHLVVYLFFIFSAREILVANPIIGILFFSALSRGEKIFRDIIHVPKSHVKSLDEVKIGG